MPILSVDTGALAAILNNSVDVFEYMRSAIVSEMRVVHYLFTNMSSNGRAMSLTGHFISK